MQQNTLFDIKPGKQKDHKLAQMHRVYGESPENICGTCIHFKRITINRTIFKCTAFGESKSTATDWRFNWTACGKHN